VAHDEQTIATLLRAAGLCPVDLHALQRAAIRNALEYAEGNRTHAAKTLGISVRTLQRTIKSWTMQDASTSGNGDIFLAAVQGRRVECRTVEDAIAIKTADAHLRNGAPCPQQELQRLIQVLTRYKCTDAAAALSQRLPRRRAAEFLTNSSGRQRPNGSADVQ
jgi:hypothetical protein